MDITIKEAAKQLRHHDHILILSHRAPDGDTLGCAAALAMGQKVCRPVFGGFGV